ncbi:hypothetical protein [Brevundimonas naejangsanensis]|uniref:hypothetical protein n=1 Tax=Brevundimonas naejangsanensis TaxID=588932 RepID=UPI001069A119|nr:hypothetical protein [Brevundimonas naejangsanensis]QBQ49514.1 hypothetical protein E3U41_12930 [Brevundimonas naejangsanensis]
MLSVIALGLALHADPETPSRQMFDLICSDRQEVTARRPKPLDDLRFRIDLTTNRFCVGGCSDMRTLTVYDDTLVLGQMDTIMAGSRVILRQSVDRHTGAYDMTSISEGQIVRQEKGQCLLAPYTGPIRGERLF